MQRFPLLDRNAKFVDDNLINKRGSPFSVLSQLQFVRYTGVADIIANEVVEDAI